MESIQVGDLVVHRGTVSHPLLGRAHVIEHGGQPVTAMSEIEWDRPTQIPTIAEPRKLPRGTGTLLLNEIASRARQAGVQSLRYAGPYPTHALFHTLLRSFRTTSDSSDFTSNVLERAMTLATDEVPIDFVPAPFKRRAMPYGYVDLRDARIDRARIASPGSAGARSSAEGAAESIDGVLYDEDGQDGSLARLLAIDDHWIAQLSVGIPIARLARLDAAGTMLDGPHPIPAFDTPANGREFPAELRDELATVAAGYVAKPLERDVANAVRTRPIKWADLGWRAAMRVDDGFALHVAMLALIPDHVARFVTLVSSHLGTIAAAAILDELLAARR